jgi:hypothetical protein
LRSARGGSRRTAAAKFGKCSSPYLLAEEEPDNVLQVGTLICSGRWRRYSESAASELTLKQASGGWVGWHLARNQSPVIT